MAVNPEHVGSIVDVKPQYETESRQELTHSASFWSTSTEVDPSAIGAQDDGCDVVWGTQPPNCIWRQHEATGLFVGHDSVSFDRRCMLSFLKKTSHAQKYLQPLCESWAFDPADIKEGLYTSVAISLEGQSLKKFKLLTFDALTQQALGISVPEILDFRLRYQWLNARIYYYFIKRRRHVQHLVKVKKELDILDADPFICAVIQNAYECVVAGQIKDADLDLPLCFFITEPLKGLFQKHKSTGVILQQLKLLKSRFASFCDNALRNWNEPFDTNTEFFDEFRSLGPVALARSLSETAHASYQKLKINSFKRERQALQNLNEISNRLCCSVKECSDAGVLSASELLQLSKELCCLRNFFSMRAVRDGMKYSGSLEETVQQIDSLVNIQHELNGSTPALYSVLQAGKQAAQGDFSLAEKLIKMCSSYSVQSSTSAGKKASPLKLMHPIDDGKLLRRKNEEQISAPSDELVRTAPFSAGVFSDQEPSRNEQMQYGPTTPASIVEENGCLHSRRGFKLRLWTWLLRAQSFCVE
ncbi:hypothetical protein N7452_004152 [Penicillium brevicompactum]|uniref:Uncharacterized protein n=1 Tax=Penicillium brevicompactum TaxID=5074 RepID=A0A9W9ULF4_PENBR|nr:hypothetical protein N7452_004152 [Penicillium brevicompactum]